VIELIERTFIQQGWRKIELEKYLRQQIPKAGFTKLDIMKTPLVTRIVLNVTRPGLVIGKGGQNIRRLTQEIEERFKIENPQIEIKEIAVPDLDASAVVDKMKGMIERGFSWRSVAYKTMRDIQKVKAQGVEIVLKGALGGKGERKRRQRIAWGYMKKTGDQVQRVDYAKASSYPKYGAIGIKVRIVRPETVFPDKIDIQTLFPEKTEESPQSFAKPAAEAAQHDATPAALKKEIAEITAEKKPRKAKTEKKGVHPIDEKKE